MHDCLLQGSKTAGYAPLTSDKGDVVDIITLLAK